MLSSERSWAWRDTAHGLTPALSSPSPSSAPLAMWLIFMGEGSRVTVNSDLHPFRVKLGPLITSPFYIQVVFKIRVGFVKHSWEIPNLKLLLYTPHGCHFIQCLPIILFHQCSAVLSSILEARPFGGKLNASISCHNTLITDTAQFPMNWSACSCSELLIFPSQSQTAETPYQPVTI